MVKPDPSAFCLNLKEGFLLPVTDPDSYRPLMVGAAM